MLIRDRLLSGIPELDEIFTGSLPADSLPERPVAVMISQPPSSSNWKGWREEIALELWVKRSATEEQELEQIAGKVVLLLDQVLLESSQAVWMPLIQHTPMEDRMDNERSARVRTLSLNAISPRPLGQSGRGFLDPWLEPLVQWSSDILGDHWKVYGGHWPIKPERPCLLWRALDMSLTPVGRGSFRCTKQFEAFVLAEDKEEEDHELMMLSQHLASTVKLALDTATRKYVTVGDIVLNPVAANDGYAVSDRGVLGITLSSIEPAASSEAFAPLMRQVHHATKN